MKILFTSFLILLPQYAFSQCYIAENFKGESALSNNGYTFGQDGFTGQVFEIHLAGSESRVSGNELKCNQIGDQLVVCSNVRNGKSVVETWSVDLSSSKALYTKSISGYGKYDGVKAFVGSVSGTCK